MSTIVSEPHGSKDSGDRSNFQYGAEEAKTLRVFAGEVPRRSLRSRALAALLRSCRVGTRKVPGAGTWWFILWYYYSMKIAISLSDDLFTAAERLGKRLKLSRSRLYAIALQEYVAKHRGGKVTEQLDRVYALEDSAVDGQLRRAQARSVGDDAW